MIDKVKYHKELQKLIERQTEMSIRNARVSFWDYTKLKAPDFYFDGRDYLMHVCHELQDFYESDDEVLIVNMPPRHGKSRSVGLFVEWLLGQSNQTKVMTGSYNETLSRTFSKGVRNSIMEVKADKDQVVYNDIFPDTQIKYGDSASNLWGLVGGHYNYLATSPTGTATGFGADILIIDDLIKNAVEAFNSRVLDGHWNWFTQTMLSRLQEGGKIIIIMTRWATGDLAGRAKAHFESEGTPIREITMKALQDDGTMLDDKVLSYDSYKSKIRAIGPEIASANYQQEPLDIKGRLYDEIKTYSEFPSRFKRIINYTDTADEGKDYHCSIVAGETMTGEAYILDVIYTKEGMEKTEPKQAEQLYKNDVSIAWVESNFGGKSYARTIQRLLWETYKTRKPTVKWFHQKSNKMARILSHASFVMDNIYFPENWADRWSEFYRDITSFQKEGKNEHDDAPDALTGIAEAVSKGTSAVISSSTAW